MKQFTGITWILVICCFLTLPLRANASIKGSVIKIYSVSNQYNYDEPWQMLGQEQSSGSGCIIKGKRILTNAHVVANNMFIQVRRTGQAKKYTAEVVTVAHACDLAILKVLDDSFFSGTTPVEIGSLPGFRDKVAVYGFPEGGDKLCITEGVVSRIEHRRYTHSGANLLACQIDAAINPGSSGGPVIKNNKIVGVAFQGMSGEDIENIGYMVPAPVINHFLKDIENGRHSRIPGIGISWQKMENPDIRLKYTLTGKQTGVLVDKIYPNSPAKGILKDEDVILSVDGNNIENDGTIEFRTDERTFFGYAIQQKYINDTAKLKILRNNKILNVEIKLTNSVDSWRLVSHVRYDVAATYYIVGGLLFEPLTGNYLRTWGEEWKYYAPKNLLNYYFYGEPTDDRREIIMLVKILADEINAGYHELANNVIAYVNGKKISTMEDLVRAFDEHNGKYYTIVDEQGYKIVIDRNKAGMYGQRILKKYKIISDRSEDLRIK